MRAVFHLLQHFRDPLEQNIASVSSLLLHLCGQSDRTFVIGFHQPLQRLLAQRVRILARFKPLRTIDIGSIEAILGISQSNFEDLGKIQLFQFGKSSTGNLPVPGIQYKANVVVTDCFDKCQHFVRLMNKPHFIACRSTGSKLDSDFRTDFSQLVSDRRNTGSVLFEVLLVGQCRMGRLDIDVAMLGTNRLGQFANLVQFARLSLEVCFAGTEIDWQFKRTDIDVRCVDELSRKFVAHLFGSTDHVIHVDLDSLVAVSQRQFDQLVLADRYSQSVSAKAFVHVFSHQLSIAFYSIWLFDYVLCCAFHDAHFIRRMTLTRSVHCWSSWSRLVFGLGYVVSGTRRNSRASANCWIQRFEEATIMQKKPGFS